VSRVGINVGLKLNSQQFSQGLDRANSRMRAFGQNMKRQQETVGRMGLGGLGRGFGIGGGMVEALSMGGMAGGIAAVAAPIAAIAGMLRLFEGMNEFRRSAAESMDKFNKDLRLGKINQIVTDQQSAFAILAAEQRAVAGPGAWDTFMQSMAAGEGGQDFFSGFKGASGAAGNLITQAMEDPSKLLGMNLLGLLGVMPTFSMDEATAAFDAGTAQNTAQAQVATEAIKDAREQRSVSLLEQIVELLS
jgi:hypothetical protein